MKPEDAIALIQRIMTDIANYEGEIPGNTAVECGNYLEHDLEDAKNQAKRIPSLYCKLDSGTAKIRIIYKQSSHNFLIVRKKVANL